MDFQYLGTVVQRVFMDVPFGSMAVNDFYESHRLAILVEQADVGAHRSYERLSANARSSLHEV